MNLPKLSPLPNGNWVLLDSFGIEVDGVSIVVPAGFETDGASIPRALWRLCGNPMEVPRLYAAICHDWLYYAKPCTRKQADCFYRDAQISFGVGRLKAYTEYYALRLFGGSHW